MDQEEPPVESSEITMTYDELFNNSFGLSPAYLSNVLKRTNLTHLSLQYRPPFVVIHEKNIKEISIKTSEILESFLMLQEPSKAKDCCFRLNGKFFYLAKMEEEMIIAKDGQDNCMVVLGSLSWKTLNFIGLFPEFSKRKFEILKNMHKIKKLMTQEIV